MRLGRTVGGMITSPSNPLIQEIRRLQRKPRARRQTGRFVAEGVRLAREALAADVLPERVLLAEDAASEAVEVARALARRGVPVDRVSARAFRAASDTETPQGVLLVLPIRDLPLPRRRDFLLLADGVRDPGNLGTLLRTALAAGVQGVLLPPGNADPYNPKVVRAAMGAHFRLPLRRVSWEGVPPLLNGLQVFLAEAHAGVPCYRADFRQPLALVIGGEARGAGAEARRLAHQAVHIPMPGGTESLNAAVAAGVLLFEVVRQRVI